MTDKWEEITDGGEQVPAWEPKKDDEIEGVLVKRRGNIGQFKSNLYTLEQKDGEKIAVWGGSIIDGHFLTLPIGTEVKIKYLGRVKGEKGNSYKNYQVWKKKSEVDELVDKADKEIEE